MKINQPKQYHNPELFSTFIANKLTLGILNIELRSLYLVAYYTNTYNNFICATTIVDINVTIYSRNITLLYVPCVAGLRPGTLTGEDWLLHISTLTATSKLCLPVLITHRLVELWFSLVVITGSTKLTTTTEGKSGKE